MIVIRNLLLLALLALIPIFNCFANEPISEYVFKHIPVAVNGVNKDMTLNEAMQYFKVPAISFAVIENNQIVWVYAQGLVSSNSKKLVNTSTLFQAGSMSKSVAALTALRLVDKNKLGLDVEVNPLLKEWKIPASTKFKSTAITLRQLLSMSSGLNIGGYYGYEPGKELPSVIETLFGIPPANNLPVKIIFKPGAKYYYSGAGYEVIQLLIDSQTGQSFTDVVQELILTPLQMSHSYYAQPLNATLNENAATATDSAGYTFPYRWRVVPEYAAGGLWSTPTDLAKLVIATMSAYQGKPNAIISPQLAKQTLQRQINTPYGLGFVIAGKGKQLHFMKLGQNAGYQGWLVGYPATGQGIVVMTNSDQGRELAQDLIYAIAKAYHWPTNGRLIDAGVGI